MMKVFVITASVWIFVMFVVICVIALHDFVNDVREGMKGREVDERERATYELGPAQIRMDFVNE
jgi:hypothetical protein